MDNFVPHLHFRTTKCFLLQGVFLPTPNTPAGALPVDPVAWWLRLPGPR